MPRRRKKTLKTGKIEPTKPNIIGIDIAKRKDKTIVSVMGQEKDSNSTEKFLKIECPNCHSKEHFIMVNRDRNEYKCEFCGKGFSGYPPPR